MSVKASSQVSMLDITDAYSVTLTSEAFAFVGNTSGAPSGLSCATQVIAYCGTQRCSKVIIGTVSCPSGISASISNNGSNAPTITFTTTATITVACEATIPVTVDGVTINKKFSFAVAKTGATGAQGYSFKVLISNYKEAQSTLEAWATPGHDVGIWRVRSTSGVKVGDSVAIQCYNSSKSGYVYVYGTVTLIDSSTDLYMISAGMTDKGDTGATGNGVSSSTVDYQVSSSGTTIPTGTWQPSVPSVSPGQYLWTRTILKYTNGSSSSASYSVGRMGTNGTNGSNGRGIKSTVVTYQAGSSGTSAPTGIWTSSIPATSASAPYLWSKTVITYTDNNAPSTTYSVGSTPEGIEIGGRNLIQSNRIVRGVWLNNVGNEALHSMCMSTGFISVKPGDSIILQYWQPKNNNEGVTSAWSGTILYFDTDKHYVSGYNSMWFSHEHMAIAGVVPSDCYYIRATYQLPTNSKGINAYNWNQYSSYKWKLELGNKATDWTPAPEDLETRVTTAESSIKETADKISLVVKSGDSETNMVLTDKVCELVANNINLNGRITISGLNSDTQTKINNGNAAKSTLDNKSAAWDGGVSTANSVNNTIGAWCYNNDRTIINGGKIAAGTITANKIAIGDFTNYCTVNANVPETMLPTSFEFGGTKVYGTSDTGGLPFTKASNSQQYLMFCDFTPFLFKPGEQLYFYGNISNWNSTDCSANIRMWLYDSNKNYLTDYTFWQGTLTKYTWNKVSGNITITNANRQSVKYFLIGIDTGITGHLIGAADLICKKKAGGELIVDGAITANKISAGAITADKLAANAITADKLAANAITGKNISGGTININNKKFYVDSGGNVEMSGTITIGKYTPSSPGITICGAVMASDANSAFYISHSNAIWLQPASSGNTTTRIYIDDDDIRLSSDRGGGSPSHGSFTITSSIMSFNCNGDGFNNSFSVTSSGITLSGPTTLNDTATTRAIIPAANATYALGEGGSKGWSNIYIGNASSTYNGLRIINGTTNYNLCGINSSNTMIFGDASWTPYIYVKNTSKPSSGAVQSFTIGDDGSTTINDTHVWLYGRNDTTSRYIGSYLVYARTYGSAANVVVTNNGVLGRSTSSSKRYKHDIREFSVDEISCLYDLPLKKFKYNNDYISKDDEYYNKDLYGFIVEDLDEVLPISVQHNLDDDAEYTIPEMWNNNIIVPCLLKLIQDLNNRLKKVEEGKEN